MPRTKASRAIATKRARDNASEIEDLLRDFDIEQEQGLQQIRSINKQLLEDVDMELENFKKSLPARILKLLMGDLKKLESYDDVDAAVQQTMNDLNMTVKDSVQKADEGYITGEASNKSRLTSDSESGDKQQKASTLSALKPFKSRRRSQSVSTLPAHTTPGPRAMMKLKTPNVKSTTTEPYYPSSTSHAPRSKYRTPLVTKTQQRHPRAASAEPIVATITPKINPSAPVAVLRHAKPGEVAFSVTGSPVVPSHSSSNTANMNIPYNNGVLMIRPESIDPAALDSTLINNIVGSSINDMRILKNALDILVSNFEKRQCKK